MALTYVPVDLIREKPLVKHNSFVVADGVLPADTNEITFDSSKVTNIDGILVFISGVHQANFNIEGNKIILPGTLPEAVPYSVVLLGEAITSEEA